MDPEQAQWQGGDGQQTSTSISLQCDPDGTIRLSSGSFKYEGDDPGQAVEAFRSLLSHGQQQAQGS